MLAKLINANRERSEDKTLPQEPEDTQGLEMGLRWLEGLLHGALPEGLDDLRHRRAQCEAEVSPSISGNPEQL